MRWEKKKGHEQGSVVQLGLALKEKWAETVTLCLCLILLTLFVSFKEGFHMDELLSFELANARFNPWIVSTQPEGRLAKFVRMEIDGETLGETLGNLADTVKDVLENRGSSKLLSYQADVYEEPVWITAKQFQDYISVDEKDAFQYLSVYFNVKDDNHPPLHFMVLHTISSFFWGQAATWMGCLVNLIAVAVVLVLLMKICRLLLEALGYTDQKRIRMVGLCVAMLYGLSRGAIATTLLIRMYGMLTLWCMAYFYLILQKMRNLDFHRHNKGLVLVTLAGFWTQYFFLFYCIPLAALVCVLLFSRKRRWELFCFVRSMAVAAAVGVALFPFAIQDVFSSGRGVEALQNLRTGLEGYGERLAAFLGILVERTFGVLFWALLLILAVLTAVLRRRLETCKTDPVEGHGSKKTGEKAVVLCLLVLPVTVYFLLAARMSPYLVDRYVMAVFPFVILWGGLLLFVLVQELEKGVRAPWCRRFTGWFGLAAVFLQVCGIWQYDGSYLYQGYARQQQAARPDYACICIYDGVGYYENLPEFTVYGKTLLLTMDQLEHREEKDSIRKLDKVAVLVKPGNGYDSLQVLELLEREYGFVVEHAKGSEAGIYGEAHGDWIYFLKKG